MGHPRVVSLLPSVTEIVASVGAAGQLVGRSHECDYPAAVTAVPICSTPNIAIHDGSREIHNEVQRLVTHGLSVFTVDSERLRDLSPDLIITQTQCKVCAVDESTVLAATTEWLGRKPEILTVSPTRLSDVIEDVRRIGGALERRQTADQLAERLTAAFSCVSRGDQITPSVVCIEWTDPLMTAGNWVPELVQLAGGHPLLAEAGVHSGWIHWDSLLQSDPDIMIGMPCGFTLQQARDAMRQLREHAAWRGLHAVRENRVFVADGHQFFNRPGPRLVDSLEILQEIIGATHRRSRWLKSGWDSFEGFEGAR